MKKLSFLMITTFVAMSSMFVSCEDDDLKNRGPLINVYATYADRLDVPQKDSAILTATEGVAATFRITFSMGVQRLSEVHIKSTIGGKTFHILDSLGLNQGIYNAGAKKIDFTYVTKFGKEDEVLEFSAWDASSKTPIETIFMVTLKSGDPAPAGRFIIKESILIGGQGNATSGSFYSVALGKRLTILTARSQPADVDFAYFYGATNKATIAAPANEDAQTIPYGAKTMSSWATKNRTLFFVVKGANGARPVDWYDENINKATKLTKAAQLAAGNVVVYKTATAQGAFVVTDIETGIAGAITINLIKKE